jgi:hypothetical protein
MTLGWGDERSNAMSGKSSPAVTTMGIDIGENSFHVIGLDARGAIVLRQKWSRGQLEARLANVPPCLIGMEACVRAHHQSRILHGHGHDTRLMPAKYVRPYSKGQKNDFAAALGAPAARGYGQPADWRIVLRNALAPKGGRTGRPPRWRRTSSLDTAPPLQSPRRRGSRSSALWNMVARILPASGGHRDSVLAACDSDGERRRTAPTDGRQFCDCNHILWAKKRRARIPRLLLDTNDTKTTWKRHRHDTEGM